jgi:hypothetical protein
MEGRTENFTPGDNFTPRGQIHPWMTTSTLGSKFAPRGKVKNGPLVGLEPGSPVPEADAMTTTDTVNHFQADAAEGSHSRDADGNFLRVTKNWVQFTKETALVNTATTGDRFCKTFF